MVKLKISNVRRINVRLPEQAALDGFCVVARRSNGFGIAGDANCLFSGSVGDIWI
jgi:hypothetical protein